VRRALAAAAAVLALAACSTAEDEAPVQDATVARVGDGDTIDLADGSRVRLVQIDAPELGEGECYGRQAAETLRELLPEGATVRLEPDARLDDVDRFGRLLRYVHVGETNVNLELVSRGVAAPWFFEGVRGRYADELLDAAREAEAERRGLWAACPAAELDPEHGVETR
jgi:endonuclease YncB( thermonuclease family)